jgi:hypothetical protein
MWQIVCNEFYRLLVYVMKIPVSSPGRAASTSETGRRISAVGHFHGINLESVNECSTIRTSYMLNPS